LFGAHYALPEGVPDGQIDITTGAECMGKAVAVMKREFLGILPAMIFFTLLFNVVAYTRALMLQHYSINLTVSAGATILALVVAKVIVVVDLFPFASRFAGRPVIYSALWRTALYSVFVLFLQYLEEFIPAVWVGHDVVAANRTVFEELSWEKFVAVHIWLTLGIFMYCAATEIAGSLGRKQFHELLFEPKPPAGDVPSQAAAEPIE